MQGNSRRRIAGVALAGMVVTGVAAVSSMSASGAEVPVGPEAGPLYTPYGTLTIKLTDRDGAYELKNPNGVEILIPNPDYKVGDTSPQAAPEFYANPETIVTNQPCATVAPDTGDHMVLTPNPASPTNASDVVQFRDSGMGVNTGNTSCGASAASLISGAEQLAFDLGGILPEDVYIESAAINWSQNKSGNLTYILEGGQTKTIEVGRNAPPRTTVAAAAFDSKTGKVVVEKLSDLFKSITIESTANKDNEGISILDGTSFNLVQLGEFEAAVDCGEQVTVNGLGDIADTVRFFRGENSDPINNPCLEVGITVEIVNSNAPVDGVGQTDFVYWDNLNFAVDGVTPQGVEGLVSITWAPLPVLEAGRLDRKIDYDGYEDGGAFETLWCLSFASSTAVTGEVTFEVTMPTYDPTPLDRTDGNENTPVPWCLVSDERVLEGGFIYQTEVLFGGGDPARW